MRRVAWQVSGLVAAGLLVAAGCAINPATGKLQLAMISERDEIEMGRDANGDVLATYGLVDDPELQEYVSGIGKRLAADSERPNLPWTFQVVDDPVVNAFALPGGYIYVTRGILAHFNSEAELAGVLGHEIGHVTARHSVNQISKQQLAGLGLGIGAVVASEYGYGGLVQDLGGVGLGLMFLKFGRDDERQADDLGVRYMLAESYDPRGMVTMFETLERIGEESGSTIPTWQSTHPAPENRRERARALLAEIDRPLDSLRDGRDLYLARIDGIVYGENPREGFFDGTTFHHPEMAFRIEFPDGWKTSNTRAAVAGASPEKDALLQLSLVPQDDLEEASKAFFGKHAVTPGAAWLSEIGGEPAVSREFTAANADRSLAGTVAWVRHDDRTVQMLALAEGSRWSARRDALRSALASFRRETDPKVLDVRPAIVRVVTLPADMTVAEAARRERDVHEKLERILTLNGMSEDRTLARGTKVKLPVGGPPRDR